MMVDDAEEDDDGGSPGVAGWKMEAWPPRHMDGWMERWRERWREGGTGFLGACNMDMHTCIYMYICTVHMYVHTFITTTTRMRRGGSTLSNGGVLITEYYMSICLYVYMYSPDISYSTYIGTSVRIA